MDESNEDNQLDTLSWEQLLPSEWLAPMGSGLLWQTCYHVMLLPPDVLSSNPIYFDLNNSMVILIEGQLEYVSLQELGVVSKEIPEIKYQISGIELTTQGNYLTIIFPLEDESSQCEKEAKDKVDILTGLLALIFGDNIVYKKYFENVINIKNNSRSVSSPVIKVPSAIPPPDITRENVSLIRDIYVKLNSIPIEKRNRIELSLRWFSEAMYSSGPDAYIKFWIALEAVGMVNTSDIRPLKKMLAEVYTITTEEVSTKFHIGRLFNIRCAIVHDGKKLPIQAKILEYLQVLYKDILFQVLDIPSKHAVESWIKEYKLDLVSLLDINS